MVKQIIEDNIMIAKFDNPPVYSMTQESLKIIRDAIKKVTEDD